MSEDTYIASIETHDDQTKWIACVSNEPKPIRIWNGLNVYHPSAKSTSSHDGTDDFYECPHCKISWWVEND
jgi:hypothetical protein